ncbi:MAG: 3-phosphoshikimate 1-carboxyvinyltransferase [Pseudonocardiaceae bacterium]
MVARHATAHVPGSKSVTARALFLAAAAEGTTRLSRPLDAADTRAFLGALATLGYPVEETADGWAVTGHRGGPPAAEATVWCHDAGTAARFLPALVALGHGRYRIDASDQMRARPMSPLVQALRDLGVHLNAAPGDRLPLDIRAEGVVGGDVALDAGISSQYLTALCLMAPATKNGLRITISRLVSAPYVELTLAMMRDFGVEAHRDGPTLVIPPATYRAGDYAIEPDASTASYFFAAAAVTGNSVTVPGLGRRSRQGDLRFATSVLAKMGCQVESGEHHTTVTGPAQLRSPGEVVMRDISDTMMTLAAIAPFADAPVLIRDVANCRVKECDRIDAITTALNACGIATRTGPDWLEITPGEPCDRVIGGTVIDCHADHRIAMASSVLSLRAPGLQLNDPSCVAKTFPGFHEELARVVAQWQQTTS